jgi:steroid 5-alpha reductase family enzyme
MSKVLLKFLIVYLSALLSAHASLIWLLNDTSSLILNAFFADLIASCVIYLYCVYFNSFSVYDPYWTTQSSALSIYYSLKCSENAFSYNWRLYLVVILVNIWAYRLMSNLVKITDISHEDWHYTDFRPKMLNSKVIFFIFGLLAFILMPTVLVFFGCVPLYYIASSNVPLNSLDFVALFVLVMAILIEGIADIQLKNNNTAFSGQVEKKNSALPCMDKGLWSLCRHPNYFGEVSFWFGLYLFGMASGASLMADNGYYLVVFALGPFAIFSMIYFGSLPMMEERQMRRREKFYIDYKKRVPFKMLPINFLFSKKIN